MRLLPPLVLCLGVSLLLGATTPIPPAGSVAPPMLLRTLQSGGMDRYFRIHVPAGYDGTSPLPLVLAFHGGGGNAQQFADHSELHVTADAEDLLLVFPEGTGVLGGPPLYRLETWNAGNCCGWTEERDVDHEIWTFFSQF